MTMMNSSERPTARSMRLAICSAIGVALVIAAILLMAALDLVGADQGRAPEIGE